MALEAAEVAGPRAAADVIAPVIGLPMASSSTGSSPALFGTTGIVQY